jgi:hypothetical protein
MVDTTKPNSWQFGHVANLTSLPEVSAPSARGLASARRKCRPITENLTISSDPLYGHDSRGFLWYVAESLE